MVAFLCRAAALATVELFSDAWGLPTRRVRRCFQAFVGEQILGTAVVQAPPLLRLDRPIFSWTPGEPEPQFGSLSHRARSRWTAPHVPTRVFYATRSAAYLFGGISVSGEALLQAGHELHMAALALRYRRECGSLPTEWLRGDLFAGSRRKRERVPDAVVVCNCGCKTLQFAVEFAGSYSSTRIRCFHNYCKLKELPYDLW